MKGAVCGADLNIILSTVLDRKRSRPSQTSLATYIANENPSWDGFSNSFRATERELKAVRLLGMISRRDIFTCIRRAYMGILWRDLSIDLVAVALRQREFATKITSEEFRGMDTPSALAQSYDRYNQFFVLMDRRIPGKRRYPNLVPTLDIDLYWQTDQLRPIPYRQWCIQRLGTPINHDDTAGCGDLDVGLRETSLAWYDRYQEPYTTEDLRQSYFTMSRKIAGVLFPPYGLYILNKGKMLNQARLGSSNKFQPLMIVVAGRSLNEASFHEPGRV